jgi:hypothetical protein
MIDRQRCPSWLLVSKSDLIIPTNAVGDDDGVVDLLAFTNTKPTYITTLPYIKIYKRYELMD